MSEFDEAPRLSSQAESQFYRALKQAVGGHYAIRAKARVEETVRPEGARGIEAFRALKGKYFDFLLLDPKSGVVRCVIAMSNPSQQLKQSMERDEYLETLCADVDLPLHFEPRQNKYDWRAVRRTLEEKLGRRLADPEEAETDDGMGMSMAGPTRRGAGTASDDPTPTRRVARTATRAEEVPVYIPEGGGGFFKTLMKLVILLLFLLGGLLAFQKLMPYHAMKYLPAPVYRTLNQVLGLVDRPKAGAGNATLCWQDAQGNKIYGNMKPKGDVRPCD